MKKLLYFLSISFLILQSCSSGDGDNNNNNATSVSDVDGNVYQTVTICNQTWTKSNLNVSHYRNGDVIPQVTNPSAWAGLTTGAWCYYNNDSANGEIYGKLYNWYAVNDPRGLAPQGWHVPTNLEWTDLTTCLGGESVAGGKLKEAGTLHWVTPNTEATNSSNYSALPGGYRDAEGYFLGKGVLGTWWSASETITNTAWHRYVGYDYSSMDKYDGVKTNSLSVRCIKN